MEEGWRAFSREEQEMQDVEREMEAQLNQQHMQVGGNCIWGLMRGSTFRTWGVKKTR